MTDKKGGEDHRRVDVVGTTTTTTDTSRKQQQHQKHDGEKQRNTKVISGKYSRECDSKRIRGIQVYKAKLSVGSDNPRKGKTVGSSSSSSKQSSSWFLKLLPSFRATSSIRLYTIIFFVLYLYQGTMVLRSIGQPYREFLLKADAEGFQIVQGSVQLRAEFNHQYRDLNDVNRRITKLGWTDWIDMDIEQLAIEKKRDKEQSVLDSIPKHLRVPGKYQTAFWPTLLFGIFVTFHAFLLLLQQWSVSFNILMNYIEMDCDIAVDIMNNVLPNIDLNNYLASHTGSSSNHKSNNGSTATTTTGTDTSSSSTTTTPTTEAGKSGSSPTKYTKDAFGNYIVFPDREITTIPSSLPTHARIISSKDDEKDVLVPIQYLPSLGMCIEYHRRKYYYNVTERMWCKIRCQTTFPVTILNQWEGFQTNEALITAQIRFGPNLFQVKQPTFTELYQKQLLNPFSVFQIFCVLLWAIDDYITYSLFSLFMVLMFEGTVVFQRLKSLQALQSMGNPSRLIYVYRNKQWIPIDSAELLPGDIISLVRIKPHRAATSTKKNDTDDKKKDGSSTKPNTVVTAARIEDEGGDIVPADLVLLRGSTVVNEASLTGESVPQMKEGITELYDPTSTSTSTSAGDNKPQPHTLSMKLRHKMNVVYAGTKMLQCSGGGGNNNAGRDDAAAGSTVAPALFQQIPEPPDHGCTCFVLRTGFASAQGKLVRMIEGSQEKVKGHEKETGLLLGLLCIFAILSSSYVLYHGMQNKNRSKYELLLHCILIVTSVIRPELPMQMALAVNNSLMTLMKLHVFCTEPYRVPVAGKLTSCLFDKTGTLTTDELVATGICSPSKLFTKVDDDKVDDTKLFTPLHEIYTSEAALVLAGCQTLVVYEDETTGDPLESAALRAMRWQISTTTGYAEPKPDTTKRPGGKPIVIAGTTIQQVAVITRHHFSSKLQRMSCIVEGIVSKTSKKKYVVAKGSPEAIGNLLGTKPAGYDTTSEYLSKQGYRVIALAYKAFVNDDEIEKAIESRAVCESNLIFAGFIAFTCMVRKDTADVLKRLKEGGMSVAMITGDALLTALHVAKEVNIVSTDDETSSASNTAAKDPTIDPELERNEELRKLIEEKRGKPIRSSNSKEKSANNNKTSGSGKPIAYLDVGSTGSLYWKSYTDGTAIADYHASDVPTFAKQYDLAMTGKCLAQALVDDPETRKVLGYIKVFARMTPDAKETVIEALHSVGALCLMCGDGANDVGALKQADVGVALLSGFGNLNVAKTTTDDDTKAKESTPSGPAVTAIMSQEHLNQIRALPVSLIKMKIRQLGTDPAKYPEIVEKEDLVKLYQIKAREVAVKRHDEQNALAQKNKSKQELALEKKLAMEEKQRQINERITELEAQGVSFATFKVMKEFAAKEMEEARKKKAEMQRLSGVEGHAAALAAQLETAGSGMDALEDMGLPMVKLGDASIAAPFTSKMPSIRSCVDIVRQGRCTLVSSMQMYQIMALQCLISSYALSVLYLDGIKYGDTQMTAMGLLGTVSHLSISRSKPLDKLSRVQPLSSIFHPASFFSLIGQFIIHLTTMVLAVRGAKQHLPPDWTVDLDGEFKPGILNTVVFLISSVQQVTVFFVNLQGRPFMTGVSENRPLLWSLIATFILTFMFASESVPGLNRYFQLVPFPDERFRDFILILLGVDLVSTFAFDRFMKFVFARDILRASIEETTMKDVMSMARTFGILAFLMYTFLGNSDTWDQLLAMEQAMLNSTAEDANVTLSTLSTITEVVPEVTATGSTLLHDEF